MSKAAPANRHLSVVAKKPAQPAGAVVSDDVMTAMIAMADADIQQDAALSRVSGPTAVRIDDDPAKEAAANHAPPADDAEDDMASDRMDFETTAETDTDGLDPEDPDVEVDADDFASDFSDAVDELIEGLQNAASDDLHLAELSDNAQERLSRMHRAIRPAADVERLVNEANVEPGATEDLHEVDYDDEEDAAQLEARDRLAAHFELAGERQSKLIVQNMSAQQVMTALRTIKPTFGGQPLDMENIESLAQAFIDTVEASPDYTGIVKAAQETFSTYVGLAQRVQRMLGGTSNAELLAGKLSGEAFSRAAVASVEDTMVLRRAVGELRKTIAANVPAAAGPLESRQDLVSIIAIAVAHLQANRAMLQAAADSVVNVQGDLAASLEVFERAKTEHAAAIENIHKQHAASFVETRGGNDWRVVTPDGRFMAIRGEPLVSEDGRRHYSLSQIAWTGDATKALTFGSDRKAADFLERLTWAAMSNTALLKDVPDNADREAIADTVLLDGVAVLRCRVGRLAVILA